MSVDTLVGVDPLKANTTSHASSLRCTHLNESDTGSKGGVDIRELKTNVSRSNDGNPLWEPLQLKGMVAGEDSLAINGDAYMARGQEEQRLMPGAKSIPQVFLPPQPGTRHVYAPGGTKGTDPVAMMMSRAETSPPTSTRPGSPYLTLCGPTNLALPIRMSCRNRTRAADWSYSDACPCSNLLDHETPVDCLANCFALSLSDEPRSPLPGPPATAGGCPGRSWPAESRGLRCPGGQR